MNLRTAIRRQERNIKKQIDVICGRSARSGLSASKTVTKALDELPYPTRIRRNFAE